MTISPAEDGRYHICERADAWAYQLTHPKEPGGRVRPSVLRGVKEARITLLPYLEDPAPKEYIAWLEQYLRNGGKPTRFCERFDVDERRPFLAVNNIDIRPLARLVRIGTALGIIVPEGIKLQGEIDANSPHTLYMPEGIIQGAIVVPLYYRDDAFLPILREHMPDLVPTPTANTLNN